MAKLFMFAGVVWELWNIRNKMSVEKKFHESSTNVWYKMVVNPIEEADQGRLEEKMADTELVCWL